MIGKKETGLDCGIPDDCKRVVSKGMIIVDNAPTLIMFSLGALVLFFLYWWLALAYALYCALSIVMFWAFICPYCSHFGTKACPCGYGSVAPRYFKRKQGEFPKVFKKNIAIMFPCWVVPVLGGIYILYSAFSILVAIIFLAFCIDAFAVIPGISRFIGCRDCENKEGCPWAK
jgi:hypothetical protein